MDCYICTDESVITERDLKCQSCKQTVCGECLSKISECPNCRNSEYGYATKTHNDDNNSFQQGVFIGHQTPIQTPPRRVHRQASRLTIRDISTIIRELEARMAPPPRGISTTIRELEARLEARLAANRNTRLAANRNTLEVGMYEEEVLQEDEITPTYHHTHSNRGQQVYQLQEGTFMIKNTAKSTLLTLPSGKRFIFKLDKHASRKVKNQGTTTTFVYDGVNIMCQSNDGSSFALKI